MTGQINHMARQAKSEELRRHAADARRGRRTRSSSRTRSAAASTLVATDSAGKRVATTRRIAVR
jgi:hypothetical protein